ncbi:Mini-ribonuclease 3 [Clostridium algidicarnis]|uniref:Mini-ribonuclease 3 n=1 Tax=Clostridium algidicarnis TaxID=37659 RepID=A0ABS6C2G9_9CLOT|nr:ribonuclease III domain-containing protein [Clostridium algidicarnis]MBB6632351.1 Mini-ribonuclease 3 [Clostridium algidicarnis]MBU3192598.1 Mini-ribonuclease 3 [Clostridium algidicarnis]MBU3196868.1 Mini-ribonuclease 3 [Clostridium algidicarnis]MBU3207093.1 Mini-ribonuclease 3 [Clostridium algidicarnis]MBU3210182.1 Mini-ribonuclease 3 [Clostridium algidicarnis]
MEYLKHKKYDVKEATGLSSLTLALIGDAVFELFIRNYILEKNDELSAHKIHVKAIGYVKASSQSKIINLIKEELSDEEVCVYKRGRNAKSHTMPKNAEVMDYRNATGFEALLGYLYLTEQNERLSFILERSINLDLTV